MLSNLFKSFSIRNYRVWTSASFISNIGTWMQRAAQDWLVLTELTDHDTSALGLTIAIQFIPHVLLLPITGYIVDYFSRRVILIVMQATMGALALLLSLLVIYRVAELWQIYVLAGLLGCASAFEGPARHAFVGELVGEKELPNAIALNSAAYNLAQILGPLAAGVLFSLVRPGSVFLINAASYACSILALCTLHMSNLHLYPRKAASSYRLSNTIRYIWADKDMRSITLMFFVVTAFASNIPIFVGSMATEILSLGSTGYGILLSVFSAGSIMGSISVAGTKMPTLERATLCVAFFSLSLSIAALAPNILTFGIIIFIAGALVQAFASLSISLIQRATAPELRGRVMAAFMALAFAGTPIGAPLIGWISQYYGARGGVFAGALAGCLAVIIGYRGVRARRS